MWPNTLETEFPKTHQVTHLLLWFGSVVLHLVFRPELQPQVVPPGVQAVRLGENQSKRTECHSYTVYTLVVISEAEQAFRLQ